MPPAIGGFPAEAMGKDVEASPAACCRICLSSEGNELISPCMCQGTQQFVHRTCLDHWRAVKEGTAFSHCTTCKAQFHLWVEFLEDDMCRRMKFQLFVARDVFLVFLAIQAAIATIAGVAYLLDRHGKFRNSFAHGGDHILSMHQFYSTTVLYIFLDFRASLIEPPRRAKCLATSENSLLAEREKKREGSGRVVRRQQKRANGLIDPATTDSSAPIGSGLTQSIKSGVVVFFALMGLCGLLLHCLSSDYPADPSCLAGCSYECLDCFAASGEASCLAIVVVIIFAIPGVIHGCIVATMAFQNIMQRHYHILNKKELTKVYIVEDLQGGYSMPPKMNPEHEQRLKMLHLM